MERQRAGVVRWRRVADAPVAARRDLLFAALLGAQLLAFAGAVASGNIPPAVLSLFRALLTI
jgi:hypothetical protein